MHSFAWSLSLWLSLKSRSFQRASDNHTYSMCRQPINLSHCFIFQSFINHTGESDGEQPALQYIKLVPGMFTKIMHDNRMRWKYSSAAFPKLKVLSVLHSGGKCSVFSLLVSGHDLFPQILQAQRLIKHYGLQLNSDLMYILNCSWAKRINL